MANFKRVPFRSKKLLASARGEECTMQVAGICNHDSATTVFCHSNSSADGKGMGQKADDCFGFYGCSDCHAWFDGYVGSSLLQDQIFMRAFKRTIRRMLDKGVLKVV